MDASAMYPQGFHPVHQIYLSDTKTRAVTLSRSAVPVKYYFIDFGISTVFPNEAHPKLVLGEDGRDQEVPELSEDIPYDPFKVDIFIIGNLLRHELREVRGSDRYPSSVCLTCIAQKYSNLEFLSPLITTRAQKDPTVRPNAEGALKQWEGLRQNLGIYQRRWSLMPRDANWIIALSINVFSCVRTTVYLVKRLLWWSIFGQGMQYRMW